MIFTWTVCASRFVFICLHRMWCDVIMARWLYTTQAATQDSSLCLGETGCLKYLRFRHSSLSLSLCVYAIKVCVCVWAKTFACHDRQLSYNNGYDCCGSSGGKTLEIEPIIWCTNQTSVIFVSILGLTGSSQTEYWKVTFTETQLFSDIYSISFLHFTAHLNQQLKCKKCKRRVLSKSKSIM